jgi:hypothetical protein
MAEEKRAGNAANDGAPAGMRWVHIPSPVPYYAVGGLWLLYALIFPLYRLLDYAIVAAISAAVFFALRKTLPGQRKLEPIPYEVAYTGDDAADALLRDGQAYLADFDKAIPAIDDEEVAQNAWKVTQSAKRVLDHIAEHPKKAKLIRRFIQYYMPTVKKMLEAYNKLEDQQIKGENIGGTMHSIGLALATIAQAFDKQLDALFQNEALDISSDITVLETMLKQEGLGDSILTQANKRLGDEDENKPDPDEIVLKL